MKIFMSFLALALLSACAEKNPAHKDNPLKGLSNSPLTTGQKSSTSESKSIQKTTTYKSKNLRITYPNPKDQAKIIIHGKEAEAIAKELKGDTIEPENSDLQIICKNKKDVTCELAIDYRNGVVFGHSEVIKKISLQGQDALLLYMLMNVVETDVKTDVLQKSGEDYVCSKKTSEEEEEFVCSFDIDIK